MTRDPDADLDLDELANQNGKPADHAERWIVIPRWEEFQHRDAARVLVPTWIKAYVKLTEDDTFLKLSLSQRGLLLSLWLLYASQKRVVSESGARARLVRSASDARRWRDNLQALNHAGYIAFSASKPASTTASNPAGTHAGNQRGENRSTTDKGTTGPHDDGYPIHCPYCGIGIKSIEGGYGLRSHLEYAEQIPTDQLDAEIKRATQEANR